MGLADLGRLSRLGAGANTLGVSLDLRPAANRPGLFGA